MSDRLQRSMALMNAKADVKMIKERANECWYDTKILANAVYLILEELMATDTADTPQTDCPFKDVPCSCGKQDECEWHTELDTPQTDCEDCGKYDTCPNADKGIPQTDCGWK